ncbi:MAG: NFACT family protein [Clostridia bacterium]|nr:NFACT family protein [Clostridia bacterium]
MAIDGLFLHFMCRELTDFAVGARIDKIYLPTRYELVLGLRSRAGNRKLFINVGGNAPRVNFTEYTPENPAKPPMICMLFRKLLSGAVVKEIRQSGLDRVIRIDLAAVSEIGDPVSLCLIVEIMGQYSNCILTDAEGTVIDALKRVDSNKSSFREILPGRPYTPPPQQDKLLLNGSSFQDIFGRMRLFPEKSLSGALVTVLSGVSPFTAKELAYRVTLSDPAVGTLTDMQWTRLEGELSDLKKLLGSGDVRPCYVEDDTGLLREFSFMPITQFANDMHTVFVPTLSELLDKFYVEKEKYQRARQQADDLFRCVTMLLERTAKKINVRRAELPDEKEIEDKRIAAELINVYLSRLPKGVSCYELENYYDEGNILRVTVSPELSPARNAQKFYKEYKKAQTAKKVLAEQIGSAESELLYLQSVKDALSRAVTLSELNEIRTELRQTGFLKTPGGQKNVKEKKGAGLPPLEFTSPDGLRVLVGRNNLQNDRLTFGTAKKNDLWFHVKNAPGSHVILVTEGEEPSDADYEFAASVAAWFSSLREGGAVEVEYTRVKNLKKPPAAKPGFVIYHTYYTMNIWAKDPEAESIKGTK